MPWLLIAIWVGVIVGVGAFVYLSWRFAKNPSKFMTKIRTNPLQTLGALALASVFLSMLGGTHDSLEKVAFITAFAVATRYLAFGLLFARLFEPTETNKFATRLDINVTFILLMVILVMYAAFSWIGVGNFADSAIESVSISIVIGFMTLAEEYIKRDLERADAEAAAANRPPEIVDLNEVGLTREAFNAMLSTRQA